MSAITDPVRPAGLDFTRQPKPFVDRKAEAALCAVEAHNREAHLITEVERLQLALANADVQRRQLETTLAHERARSASLYRDILEASAEIRRLQSAYDTLRRNAQLAF